MSAVIAFEEIERSAESALGYALVAKTAKHFVTCAFALHQLCDKLKFLVGILTPEKIEMFTPKQAELITGELQKVYVQLRDVVNSKDVSDVIAVPILGSLIKSPMLTLGDLAIDISDIIDDLVLLNNPNFKRVMSDCASSVGI